MNLHEDSLELPIPKGNYARLSLLALSDEPDVGLTPAEIWRRILEKHKEYSNVKVYNGIKKSIGSLKPRYATTAGVARGGSRTKLTQAGFQCAMKLRRMYVKHSGLWDLKTSNGFDPGRYDDEKYEPESDEETLPQADTFLSSWSPPHTIKWKLADWSWDPNTLCAVPVISIVDPLEEPVTSERPQVHSLSEMDTVAPSNEVPMTTMDFQEMSPVSSTSYKADNFPCDNTDLSGAGYDDEIGLLDVLQMLSEDQGIASNISYEPEPDTEALNTFFEHSIEREPDRIPSFSEEQAGAECASIVQCATDFAHSTSQHSAEIEGDTTQLSSERWADLIRNYRLVIKFLDKAPNDLNSDFKRDSLNIFSSLLPERFVNMLHGYLSPGCVKLVIDVEATEVSKGSRLSNVAPALLSLVTAQDPTTRDLWNKGRVLLQWEGQMIALEDGEMKFVGPSVTGPKFESVTCCVLSSPNTQQLLIKGYGFGPNTRVNCRFNGRYLQVSQEESPSSSQALQTLVINVSGFEEVEGIAFLEAEYPNGLLVSEPSLILVVNDAALVEELSAVQHTQKISRRDLNCIISELGRIAASLESRPRRPVDLQNTANRFRRLLQLACDLKWPYTARLIVTRAVRWLSYLDSLNLSEEVTIMLTAHNARKDLSTSSEPLLLTASCLMSRKTLVAMDDLRMSKRLSHQLQLLFYTPVAPSSKNPDEASSKNPDEAYSKNPDEASRKNPDEASRKNPDEALESSLTSDANPMVGASGSLEVGHFEKIWRLWRSTCGCFVNEANELLYATECYKFVVRMEVIFAVFQLMVWKDASKSNLLLYLETASVLLAFMFFQGSFVRHLQAITCFRQIIPLVQSLVYVSSFSSIEPDEQLYLRKAVAVACQLIVHGHMRSYFYIPLQVAFFLGKKLIHQASGIPVSPARLRLDAVTLFVWACAHASLEVIYRRRHIQNQLKLQKKDA